MPVRVIAFLGAFLLSNFFASAQPNKIDSLERILKTATPDSNKVLLLNQVASMLREKDNNKAFGLAQEAKILAESLGYKKGLAQSLNQMGWILYRRGDFAKSFETSTQALKVSEEVQDRYTIARCLIGIAAIHFEQKQYARAIENFKKAYHVSQAIEDQETMARSLSNIGYALFQMNKIDSSLFYVKQGLQLSEQSNIPYLLAFGRRTLGDIYLTKNDTRKALENFQSCLDISLKERNAFLQTSTLHRIGKVHWLNGDAEKALSFLTQNIGLAEQHAFREELERTYKLISEIYYAKNNIGKAYEYQSKYTAVHDSLYAQRNIEQIALMQARFDTEIKQAQIELLIKESELKEGQINSQRVWLYFYIGCLSLFGILAFVLFYANRQNRTAKRELEDKNIEIQKQAQQLSNLNATKDKLFSIISHDLRSPVASLRALMELAENSGITREEFVEITKALKLNLDSVYEDLDNLLLWAQAQLKGLQVLPEPVTLKTIADEKIALFNETAKRKKISIINQIEPDAIVFADINHISLALRNLIANAIKFNPTGGSIMLSSVYKGDYYEISVADSGIGISLEDLDKLFNAETHFTKPGTHKEKGLGIGLLLTKEFIESNHGSIWATSELGKGTRFTFTLKANQPEPQEVLA